MKTDQLPAPQRSHARSNRARILAIAREELAADPDASLEEIARAAGVVRRTLYGHFPNRQALISALAREATEAIEETFAAARRPDDDPVIALARMTIAAWAVGDRYRMLISLARRDLGQEGIRTAVAPARAEVTSILERGQREGCIAGQLPAPVLSEALEAMTLGLVEAQNTNDWDDPRGAASTVTVLLAAGVPAADAHEAVRVVLGEEDPDGTPSGV